MKKYIRAKSENANKKLMFFLASVTKEYNSFFNFKINDPLIYIVTSRKDFDLIVGRKTENWLVAITRGNNIYILDKEKFSKESNHKSEDFWQTLRHEYSHVYYTQITHSHFPRWLNEGLAGYLSNKKLIIDDKIQSKIFNIFFDFNKCNADTYRIGQFWVKQMIKKFGKRKLLELIKSLDFDEEMSIRRFAIKFYKVYGFQFNKKNVAKFLK